MIIGVDRAIGPKLAVSTYTYITVNQVMHAKGSCIPNFNITVKITEPQYGIVAFKFHLVDTPRPTRYCDLPVLILSRIT